MIVLLGLIVLVLAPFVGNWFAFFEGERRLPVLSVTLYLDLLLALAGIGVMVMLLTSKSILPPSWAKLRFLFAGLLIFGGPIYYFTFTKPAAELHLQGLARSANREIDLKALQNWAAAVIRGDPVKSINPGTSTPLDWNEVPADARSFLEKNSQESVPRRAIVRSSDNGQKSVELEVRPRRLFVGATNLPHQGDPFWNCELASGIYLQNYIRP